MRPDVARLVLAAVSVVAMAAHPTRAQEPATPAAAQAPAVEEPAREPPVGRTLNGHRFMPTAAVSQPFATTSLASYLIVGLGSTTGSLQVGDRVFSGSFDYAGAGGFLGYEYAFLDYFSARLSIVEAIYSGINGKSALVVGTEVQIGGNLGVTASMPLGDSVRLGLLFDVGYSPNLAITLGTGVASIINSCIAAGVQGCSVNTDSLFGSTNVLSLQPAVSASWAPFRSMGITGSVGYVYASQTKSENTVTGQAAVLATAVDFDFLAISSVPIGLQAQFAWTAPFTGGGLQHVTDLGGGLFYTGRKDLSAGLQFINRRFAITPDVDVSWSAKLLTLGLRYYWQ